jgi:UDP-N-acetylglucosamine--N-acetylmuramyl-(pentapeptide) pyrophosphoryl-undecaprenol N-acetylglucosamine transferase
MKTTMKHKFIISGGGTGGHIYPAISIANALKAKYPDADILFVGAKDRMEMEKVPAAGYEIVGLPVIGLQRKLSPKLILFVWRLFISLIKAGRIIKQFKPSAVIGVGGYVSAPVLRRASRKGIPCLIQEQNSFPGIANKMLAKSVDKICVAYPGLEKWFPKDKIIFTGNPVRQDITSLEPKNDAALDYFGLDKDKPVVVALGGSLGARTINQALAQNFEAFETEGIQLVWQSGKRGYDKAHQAVPDTAKGIKVYEFVYRMDYAYSVADVVITRAGASTISELCLVEKPAVFVPSPNVAEDHQRKNAMALVEKSAATMVEDNEAIEKLVTETISLIKDTEKQSLYRKNIKQFARPDAANHIAGEIIKLIET